jgi:hypothetical protein
MEGSDPLLGCLMSPGSAIRQLLRKPFAVSSQRSLVRGPKALCELHRYVYDAWPRMAASK